MIIETMGRRRKGNTVSLLHFDGVDESRTFTDETGKIWNYTGNSIYLRTSYKKFGTASLGAMQTSYITTPYTTELGFINKDFTIDFWIKDYNQDDTSRIIFSKGFISVYQREFAFYSRMSSQAYKSYFVVYDVNGNDHAFISNVNTNTKYPNFYHIAVVRYSNLITIYIDGISGGSLDVSGYTLVNYENDIDIGGNTNAYIDEFRISRVARWTSNFTPPTSAYALD